LAFADRGAIYEHLGPRVIAGALVAGSPASSRVAFAWSALAADAPRHEAAQHVLESLADPALPPGDAVARDAWRLYARAAAPSDDEPTLERVCRLGLAFASCCPGDPSVGEVLGFAAHAAEKRVRRASSAEAAAKARDDLLAVLRLLASGPIELEESSRDPWRLALGRLMLDAVQRGPLNESMRSAGEAMKTLRQVTGDEAGLEGEALLARVWSALLRVAEDSGDEEAPVGRVAMQLLDLCDSKRSRAASSASSRPELFEVMTVCRAQAMVALRRPADALLEIERFIGVDAPGDPAALEVGIEAYLALEREAEARDLASRSKTAPAVLARLSRRGWREIAERTDQFIAGEPPVVPPPAVGVFRLAAEFAADSDQALMHRARLAWSLLLGGNAGEAANVFQAAHAADPASAGLRRGLGESLLTLGDEAGAFAAFSAVAQAFEARQDFSRDYWHAWTRMLEILSRRPRTPDEDARLRREVARLRSLDSALQQPDCMVRIKAVEDAVGQRE
jgi:tetratricopeptide (TPR) repeat protein